MPRDYAKVSPRFWTGDTGRQLRALGAEAQLVALYLVTSPSSNMVGLYYLPVPTLSHETGLTIEGASKALRSLGEVGFAHYDHGQEVVWVPEMAAHQIAEELDPKDKRVQGIIREAATYRKCRFYGDLLAKYRDAFHLAKAPPPEPTRSPLEGPSKALRSQEQEQEQEQEHFAAEARKREKLPEPEKRPAKKNAARVNAAAPEGSAPAVQDSGEAAAGGIPVETRGAAGPGHLRVLPVRDEAPKPRRFPIADLRELGPLGAEWRGLLERELGKGLAVAAAEESDAVKAELEQLLERPGYGGVDRALAWTVTTLAARRRSKAPEAGSVRYLLPLLRSMPPLEVGAYDRVRAECPEWGRVLDAAMALPPGNAPTMHQLEDVLLPLRATFLRGELTLEVQDKYQRGYVEEFWLGGLTRLAQETIGPHVLVHLTTAPGVAEAAHA